MRTLRAVLMGSESLLVQCAEILRERGHAIAAIVSREPAILDYAKGHGIDVVPPGKGLVDRLRDHPFEWLFSIANLDIIPPDVVALPRKGAINFHDGVLPRFAGLNCPVWAIARREKTHGITWHVIEGGIDEGDMLKQRVFDITEGETALTLNTKCYEKGIETFGELVRELEEDRLERVKQDLSVRTYFGKHERPRAAGVIDFHDDAGEIAALVRALDHGTYRNPIAMPKVLLGNDAILVGDVVLTEADSEQAPGTIVSLEEGLEVAARGGTLLFRRMVDRDGVAITHRCLDTRYKLKLGAALPRLDKPRADQLGERAKELAKHEDFWGARLRLVDPVQLPHAEHVPGTVSEQLVRVPIELRVNDAATLLAATAALLSRLNGRTTFTLGYRDQEIARLADGYAPLLAPVVPLSVGFGSGETFSALTLGMASELLTIKKRQTYMRDLVPRTPGATVPALDVVYEETDALDRSKPLAFAARGQATPAMTVLRAASGEVELVFDASRVPETSRREVAKRFTVLMRAALATPDTRIAKLAILTEGERAQILHDWNATDQAFERKCVHELFEQQVDRTPDAIALSFERDELTYRQLDERSNQLAHELRALGVGPDVRVGLAVPRSLELVIGALAIEKAGGAYVPLDPAYPRDRIALMIEDSGVPVIVTNDRIGAELPKSSAKVVHIDGDRARIDGHPKARVSSGVNPAHLAYVIYTSGSTGKPKGVMVEHRNVANFFAGMDARIAHPSSPRDKHVWLAVTSLSFDISVLELFWTLARGFKVVIASDEDRAIVSGGAGSESASQTKNQSTPIQFSLFYFASDEGEQAAELDADHSRSAKYKLLLDGARFADENGFAAVWTPERHFHAFGGLYPNPSVASAAIATITRNVKIRAGSCVTPLHHPIRIAEEWALVDNLSNGRVGISVASGWHPNDFVLRPQSFADAKQQMVRDIDTLRALWRGEKMTFEGPKGPVEIRTLPRPVQKELPIWVTAAGNPETFAAAGKKGTNILTHLLGQTIEEVGQKIDVYRKARREAGHEGPGHVTLMLHTLVGRDHDEVRELARGPMKAYLRTAGDLIKNHAWAFPAFKKHAKAEVSFQDNFASLSPEDMEAVLDYAFERYFEGSGLFGTVETAMKMVDACKGIGVDEIACLIDYGVESKTVFANFEYLNALKKAAEPRPIEVKEGDFSLAAQIARHSVTHLQCTPSMARMLVANDESRAALRDVAELMVGGEALPSSLAGDLLRAMRGGRLTNMYGPTETTIWSSTEVAEPTVANADATVSIGRPIANTQLYVLDASLEPVPVGVPGELYIGGVGVTRGYLGRDEMTAERFVPDPFRGVSPFEPTMPARMYRTGDLARFMADGRVDFLGRVDHQVKIRGFRIELGEIEAHLDRFAGVRESVVIAREDRPGDKRLVGYYVVAAGGKVDVTKLREHLAKELPVHMVPAHLIELTKLPLTPNQKVDRKQLPRPDETAQPKTEEYVVPESGPEEQIAGIWRRILGLSRVSANDNFFELGGHSLLAIQAHREIKDATGHAALTITDIFRFPTLRALAEHIGGAEGGEALSSGMDRAAARRDAMSKRRARARGK